MFEIPKLIKAKAENSYRLFVKFEDDIEGIIDLSKWKGKGVFEYWNDESNFRNFKINEDNKIEWNEMIDMDPDAFYLKLVGKTIENHAFHL